MRNVSPEETAKLLDYFRYNPVTGAFYRIGGIRPSKYGPVEPYLKPNGYGYLSVDGQEYLAHRLAWLLMRGYWPGHEIDHKNRIRTDFRWKNLRPADRSDQLANSRRQNTSGLRGAYPAGRRFLSQIVRKGVYRYLGTFDTAEEAHAAYVAAAKEVHGDFACDGSPPCVDE